MDTIKYRIRLVLEEGHSDFEWDDIRGRTLFDASPNLEAARQAFDDALATLDAKRRADELRESDY